MALLGGGVGGPTGAPGHSHHAPQVYPVGGLALCPARAEPRLRRARDPGAHGRRGHRGEGAIAPRHGAIEACDLGLRDAPGQQHVPGPRERELRGGREQPLGTPFSERCGQCPGHSGGEHGRSPCSADREARPSVAVPADGFEGRARVDSGRIERRHLPGSGSIGWTGVQPLQVPRDPDVGPLVQRGGQSHLPDRPHVILALPADPPGRAHLHQSVPARGGCLRAVPGPSGHLALPCPRGGRVAQHWRALGGAGSD
mmetsp:Transcript_137420/g.325479  ORF Transcript_137420/g.325479 Transcript_137420/m.325479 type:complete len:256 (-) Transcript_137420:1208-1975(-)